MKRVLVGLVVALLLSAATVPTDARPVHTSMPPRPYPTPPPPLLLPRAQPMPVPAHALVRARLLAKHRQALASQKNKKQAKKPLPPPSTGGTRGFDWTRLGVATRVRDQGHAGTCWACAGVEALEANYEIQADTSPFLAVQPILDQLRHVQGGDACLVFPELQNKGTGLEQNYPYLGGKLNPPENEPLPYKALMWGYVGRPDRQATVAQIKTALRQYGPLYTALYASTPGFKHNKGELLNEKVPSADVNHAVLIVGWDDAQKAWKIKNSWGANRWGDKGFGWVAYGHYGIGTSTAWVQARVGP
jgi:C1A family cysteine protease